MIVWSGSPFSTPPTRSATDGEFLRRVYLDLVGRIPTSDEARAFLADTSPNKRAAVVDQLRSAGVLRQIAPGIDYPADVWSALHARVEEMSGPMSVARLRDELRTSRRHAEAILAAVAADRGSRRQPVGDRRRPRR